MVIVMIMVVQDHDFDDIVAIMMPILVIMLRILVIMTMMK
jgi:hypothetical protein